jgi:endonuclease-3 related protein
VSRPDAGTAAAPPVTAPQLLEIYRTLDERYRDDVWHWMPDVARGPFDVIAGAVLVQHTSWRLAERALDELRAAGALHPTELLRRPAAEIERLVRVSGMPRIKAQRLRAVAATVDAAGGLDALLALPPGELRRRLLATRGIGPETADAIVLYAAAKPAFVIDAYTRRTFGRLGLRPHEDSYDGWQRMFVDGLGAAGSVELYQRYHGHIVLHAKALCRATPRCATCPLLARCTEGRSRINGAAAS